MGVQSEKDQTSLEWLPRESLLHLKKPQDWGQYNHSGDTKHNAQHYIWKMNKQSMLVSTVKHSWGMMIQACFAATGPRHLVVLESTMNSSVYQSIIESNMRLSVWQFDLVWNWMITGQWSQAFLQQNGWKRISATMFQSKTSTWLKCCGKTLGELCIN